MTSTLGHAILGLLARRPSTGYDLARRMDRPVGWFWTARHSQIYAELARLEHEGLVDHEEVDGAGREFPRLDAERIFPRGDEWLHEFWRRFCF